MMLQFSNVTGSVVHFINPRHVAIVSGAVIDDVLSDKSCFIGLVGNPTALEVRGGAAEVQLRIWKALITP